MSKPSSTEIYGTNNEANVNRSKLNNWILKDLLSIVLFIFNVSMLMFVGYFNASVLEL